MARGWHVLAASSLLLFALAGVLLSTGMPAKVFSASHSSTHRSTTPRFTTPGLTSRLATPGFATPQISVQVNLVSVPVTVTDARGEFVRKLSRDDFRLLVDGSEQPVEYFSSEDKPAELLILVETGPAVYLLQGEHIAAATALMAGLAADDRVAVASYGDAPKLLLDFTADKGQAIAALSNANYGLGKANLNFYASLASAMDWVATAPVAAAESEGKRAIVVMTTGLDSSGAGSWQLLLQQMRESNVLVLPVALGGDLRGAAMRADRRSDKGKSGRSDAAGLPSGQELSFAESTRALQTIAEETGGRAFFPRKSRDFEDAYRRIAALLRHQYSLGFNAPVADGHYHTIQVQLRGQVQLKEPAESAESAQLNGTRGLERNRKLERSYQVHSRWGFLAPAQSPAQ